MMVWNGMQSKVYIHITEVTELVHRVTIASKQLPTPTFPGSTPLIFPEDG